MRTSLFLLVITTVLLHRAKGFSPAARVATSSAIRRGAVPRAPSTRLHSTDDKRSEIEALEERLRELKGEETPVEIVVAEPAEEPDPVPTFETASDRVALVDPDGMEDESEDSIMFSERWKEAKESYVTKREEEGMGIVMKAALALGFVMFLGWFSQVPVGDESLQRYQDIKGNPSRIDLGDLNPDQ